MKAGKLPHDLLARLLERLPEDPRLLLGPGIGRDAAAIDIGNGRVLVAAADPVTFAADQIGRYAVHVNANDVACLGATPAWFMATVLLRMPGLDTLDVDAQTQPSHRELGEAVEGVAAREWHAVISANHLRQSEVLESPLKNRKGIDFLGGGKGVTGDQIAAGKVGDG